MQEQIFESFLFLNKAIKKAKKDNVELKFRFVRFGNLSEGK